MTLIATAVLLGVGGAIASAKTAVQLYIYTAGQQAWNQPVNDQNPSHYQTLSGSPNCLTSTNICTYTFDGTNFVQNTEGTHQ